MKSPIPPTPQTGHIEVPTRILALAYAETVAGGPGSRREVARLLQPYVTCPLCGWLIPPAAPANYDRPVCDCDRAAEE